MRKLLILNFLLFLNCHQLLSQVVPGLESNFQWLRDSTSQLEIDSAERAKLEDLLDFAEGYALDASTEHYVTHKLLEAFLAELVAISFPLDSAEGLLSREMRENGNDNGNSLNDFVAHTDGIIAYLFFNSLTAPGVPELPGPPKETCSVRILRLSIGPYLGDPNGTLDVTTGDLVQLEAVSIPSLGTFSWSESGFGEYTHPFFQQGARCQFRAIEPPSFTVKVRLELESGELCEDVIRIHIHGEVETDG